MLKKYVNSESVREQKYRMKKLSNVDYGIALNATMLIFAIFLLVPGIFGYPNGAPPGVCTLDKFPNHNNLPAQTSPVPYEIFMSKDRVTSLNDKITVTIRSTSTGPTFKGFLIFAKDKTGAPVGTWEDNDSSHPISGCSATTHDKNTEKRNVELIWKPKDRIPDGPISMIAVIVQRFDLFWENIPVLAKDADKLPVISPTQGTESPTSKVTTIKGGVPLPGLNNPSVISQSTDSKKEPAQKLTSTIPKIDTISTAVTTIKERDSVQTKDIPTTTVKATTTKRRSFIDRLLNRGGSSDKITSTAAPTTTTTTTTTAATTTTTTTTTTTIKPTTLPPAVIKKDSQNKEIQERQDTGTTSSTTTKPPGFFKRLFGRKDS